MTDRNEVANHEKLIEEAASAIHSVAESGASWGDARMADKDQHRAEARAALAVFEEALGEATVTPTDDEREALLAALHAKGFSGSGEEIGWDEVVIMVDEVPDIVFGLGFRRSEVPEPSAERELTPCGNLVCTGCRACGCPALGVEPQRDPTDDEREALAFTLFLIESGQDEDWLRGVWANHPAEHPVKVGYYRQADAILAAGFCRSEVPEPSAEVEFPFTHEGVTLEQDDGGLWITVNNVEPPRWLGPKAIAALRAAWAEPQGEPSDATLGVMAQRFYEASGLNIPHTAKPEVVAGLRAAWEVR